MSAASDRVKRFLDERERMRGLSPDLIHAANGVDLTTSDLREMIHQIEDMEEHQ